MKFTKTDYIQYLNCPKSLWLLKHRPEDYPHAEFSLFLEKLIKEGYEVEAYAQKLFPYAADIPEQVSPEYTKKVLEKGTTTMFQAAFATDDGVFARVDVIQKKDDGTWKIFEVKSSTDVKTDKKHNHLKDAAFQKYVMENTGHKVSEVHIIHLNKEYVRDGDIDPEQLLKIVDVTERVDELYEQVGLEIQEAVKFLAQEMIGETACSCIYNTRSNHCDTFEYFNKGMPEHSIYQIGRISKQKIVRMVDNFILDMRQVGEDFECNEKQCLQIESAKKEDAIVEHDTIGEKLGALQFPLHFIDYETYASAVPRIDGLSPHEHVPFQVSIHTLHQDGRLEHFEYLADKLELPEKLIKYMKDSTGREGTFISWHAGFEQSRNRDMIKKYPEHRDYLLYQNENMFDLETIFMLDYVDYRFKGSTSIKNVLPVLLPNLSYKNLEVQNGTMALDLWGRLAMDPDFPEQDKEKTRKDLLAYCELDTFAMVEIYRKLLEIIES